MLQIHSCLNYRSVIIRKNITLDAADRKFHTVVTFGSVTDDDIFCQWAAFF